MTGIISQNVGRTSGLIKAASGGGGVWTKIKTLTASADATLDFVDGSDDVTLDSTYPIYRFSFINIHPATNHVDFSFNLSSDSGSNYNVTKTTTSFLTYHNEGGSETWFDYNTSGDLAQGTGVQIFNGGGKVGGDNDHSLSGEMWLFGLSSTTFVKHFIAEVQFVQSNGDYSQHQFVAGYANTTSAVDAVQFAMSADEIDAGKIKLYGLKDSA